MVALPPRSPPNFAQKKSFVGPTAGRRKSNPPGFAFLRRNQAELTRTMSEVFRKRLAEMAQAVVTDFQCGLGDVEPARLQQLCGTLQTQLPHIACDRLPGCLREEPAEMKRTAPHPLCKLVQRGGGFQVFRENRPRLVGELTRRDLGATHRWRFPGGREKLRAKDLPKTALQPQTPGSPTGTRSVKGSQQMRCICPQWCRAKQAVPAPLQKGSQHRVQSPSFLLGEIFLQPSRMNLHRDKQVPLPANTMGSPTGRAAIPCRGIRRHHDSLDWKLHRAFKIQAQLQTPGMDTLRNRQIGSSRKLVPLHACSAILVIPVNAPPFPVRLCPHAGLRESAFQRTSPATTPPGSELQAINFIATRSHSDTRTQSQ